LLARLPELAESEKPGSREAGKPREVTSLAYRAYRSCAWGSRWSRS